MAFFLRYLAAIVAILAVGLLLERFARPGLAFWWMAAAFGLQSLLSAAHLAQRNHGPARPRPRERPTSRGRQRFLSQSAAVGRATERARDRRWADLRFAAFCPI